MYALCSLAEGLSSNIRFWLCRLWKIEVEVLKLTPIAPNWRLDIVYLTLSVVQSLNSPPPAPQFYDPPCAAQTDIRSKKLDLPMAFGPPDGVLRRRKGVLYTDRCWAINSAVVCRVNIVLHSSLRREHCRPRYCYSWFLTEQYKGW